jgi:CDP-glucose 4,6-dehydratase
MENLGMKRLFQGIYEGKRVFVTGNSGFKGSWLNLWLNELGAEVTGFSLEPPTVPSHSKLLLQSGVSFTGDIRTRTSLHEALAASNPEIIFHLAAQPLVRASYADPMNTYSTNIIGTINLFEEIRKRPEIKAIVNITTDKVYSIDSNIIAYKETDRLGGHDPYSTSKACIELIHESYRKSFFSTNGIKTATVRAGNVIGGGDWADDRLFPDLVRAITKNQLIDIRNPTAVRPWQHVLDPLSGYLLVGKLLLEGNENAADSWNFGPELSDCLTVAELMDKFNENWKGLQWKNISGEQILHESQVLKLDCTKANVGLAWKPIWDVDKAIKKTTEWYKGFYQFGSILTYENLGEYVADAALEKAVWTI